MSLLEGCPHVRGQNVYSCGIYEEQECPAVVKRYHGMCSECCQQLMYMRVGSVWAMNLYIAKPQLFGNTEAYKSEP